MNRLGSFPVSPGHINPPVILGPNISGEFSNLLDWGMATANGSILLQGRVTRNAAGGDATSFASFRFNAANSNSIYGTSDVLQPMSSYSLMIIKV